MRRKVSKNKRSARTFILHLRSWAQRCQRYGVARRLRIRAKKKFCACKTRRILKHSTTLLSKRNFQAKIAQSAQENSDNFAPAGCFTNASSRTDTLSERFRAIHWRRTPVALIALQGTTEMECRLSHPRQLLTSG